MTVISTRSLPVLNPITNPTIVQYWQGLQHSKKFEVLSRFIT